MINISKKSVSILFGLVFISSIFPTASVKATETYTTYATEDSEINSEFPTTNYGGAVNLFQRYLTSGHKESRVLFKFDLSPIPAGSELTRANISVFSLSDGQLCYGGPSGDFYIAQIDSAWNEGTVTWNNQPSTYQNQANSFPCKSTSGYTEMSVFYIVDNIVKGNAQNNGFMIFGLNNNSNWLRTIRSKETGQSSTAKITVVYTPPSTPADDPASSSDTNDPDGTTDNVTGESSTTDNPTANDISKSSNMTAISPIGTLKSIFNPKKSDGTKKSLIQYIMPIGIPIIIIVGIIIFIIWTKKINRKDKKGEHGINQHPQTHSRG